MLSEKQRNQRRKNWRAYWQRTPKWKKALKRRINRYKVSLKEQVVRWNAQGGCCAICLQALQGFEQAHIDHCHNAGTARGFLCGTCNRGIGQLKDSPALCTAAAAYLNFWTNR